MLGGPELLKIIIIMTNQNVADISALQTATDTAKDSGIVVVVLNANQLTNVIWSDYATSYEDTFQPEPFSMQNARFIYDRLCRGMYHQNDIRKIAVITQKFEQSGNASKSCRWNGKQCGP